MAIVLFFAKSKHCVDGTSAKPQIPNKLSGRFSKLDEMITDGLVTLEKADVIRYVPRHSS
jgi:hypothetical protein